MTSWHHVQMMVIMGVAEKNVALKEGYVSMVIVRIQEEEFVHVLKAMNAFKKSVTKFAIGEQNVLRDISAVLEYVLRL